ncbi:MBL fold metallo-hydrolase [Paenibacillus antri]|uniref:MBL fold metallo-hydrolase n=1 Tax=Paenibacillus antri TaxID=2582848 RepID=A0A5R9GM20_9BACL|nr:MBL fold metallo-hydrolase [Paenibacillus antri]TLS52935.1 MBL fold metallo-hydrolase [Paenibacillus antri]
MSHAVKLTGNLYVVAGDKLTHGWDASAYLVLGDEPALIDCGSTAGYPALKRNLEGLGLSPRDIKRVYATHGHWDHISGYALLKEDNPDVELHIHEAARASVEAGDAELTAAFLYDLPFPKMAVDGLLEDGATTTIGGNETKLIHTPGHTPACVSFLLQCGGNRVLIAGDTMWGGFHPRIKSDMDAWHRSLSKLAAEEFEYMSFGHLPPTLVVDAKTKVVEAQKQLGVYFNPWFKPFHTKFMY